MRGRNAALICASVGPEAASGKAGSAVKQLTLAVAGAGTVRQVLAGSPEFFTLYETSGPEVHTSAAYFNRLNHPTEQTRRVAPMMIRKIL